MEVASNQLISRCMVFSNITLSVVTTRDGSIVRGVKQRTHIRVSRRRDLLNVPVEYTGSFTSKDSVKTSHQCASDGIGGKKRAKRLPSQNYHTYE